jgi:hypothetical protein
MRGRLGLCLTLSSRREQERGRGLVRRLHTREMIEGLIRVFEDFGSSQEQEQSGQSLRVDGDIISKKGKPDHEWRHQPHTPDSDPSNTHKSRSK